MLYILMHKTEYGTGVEFMSRNRITTVKEFVRRYNEGLQEACNADIVSTDYQDNTYAEIVTTDDETEWWFIAEYKEEDIK